MEAERGRQWSLQDALTTSLKNQESSWGHGGCYPPGEFYKQVAHTAEKGNSVILRHLSIPNTVAIAFVSSESQRDGSAKGRYRYRGDGWFESMG